MVDFEFNGRVSNKAAQAEQILANRFGAVGRGLGEKFREVEHRFDEKFVKKFWYVNTVRNKITHEPNFFFEDYEKTPFIKTFDEVIDFLENYQLEQAQNSSKDSFVENEGDWTEFGYYEQSETKTKSYLRKLLTVFGVLIVLIAFCVGIGFYLRKQIQSDAKAYELKKQNSLKSFVGKYKGDDNLQFDIEIYSPNSGEYKLKVNFPQKGSLVLGDGNENDFFMPKMTANDKKLPIQYQFKRDTKGNINSVVLTLPYYEKDLAGKKVTAKKVQ